MEGGEEGKGVNSVLGYLRIFLSLSFTFIGKIDRLYVRIFFIIYLVCESKMFPFDDSSLW